MMMARITQDSRAGLGARVASAELMQVADKIREERIHNGGQYDCIIGASGGLDSTYVIYVARHILGLNPLVVKYDNGFGHMLANQNLTAACRKLGVDLRIVPPIARERQYLQHSIQALRKLGVFFSTCFSCHYTIKAVVYKFARENNISYMLVSTNPFEERLSQSSHGFMVRQLATHLVRVHPLRIFGFLWHEILAQMSLALLKLEYDGLSLAWLRNLVRLHPETPSDIKKVDISQFIPWDLPAIEQVIRDKLEWASPRDTVVPYMRFDCLVLNLIDYSFRKTAGVSEHGILCNYAIQNGIVTKEEAADDLAYFNDEKRLLREANKVLAELGIEPLDS